MFCNGIVGEKMTNTGHALISLAAVYAPEDQRIVDILSESFRELERAEEHFERVQEHLLKARELLREGGSKLLEKLDAGATESPP